MLEERLWMGGGGFFFDGESGRAVGVWVDGECGVKGGGEGGREGGLRACLVGGEWGVDIVWN